ncbi:hypothetical protein [Azospirillum halopraeferens]|uniref:hypothetical protein n=1 Tax=Azospirillum halopraeferens TaxID=34010 RepID=UPI001FE1C88D|nr:hypothetical protein [Azospirillum halopraeferens]
MRDTHFDFQHKIFSLSGAFFAPDPTTKEPVLNITLGDLKAALPFQTLKESFNIAEDSHDSRLLGTVARGLRYVKQIRPGEKIPGELLDGSASWSVDDKHRLVARGRLTVQLVSWITGSEMIVVDIDELEQIVEDPQTKARLKSAFAAIAEKLGITENADQYITDRVDDLTQELSYIEALRDRFRHIRAISDNLVRLSQIYRTDRTFVSEIARMQGLLKRPLKEYDAIFEQADAQTGEIVGALKSFETTVTFIRKIRDDLREKLIEWEELLQAWDGVPIEKSQTVEQLQKITYRFLANRYMESKVWERK